MNATEQISQQVDSWIHDEELPPRADFKISRTSAGHFDPCEGFDDDEREAYREHRHWFLTREFHLLDCIPRQEKEDYFRTVEDSDAISFPFSSADFRRLYPFNKYHYKLKKIYERVKDLADTYASISNEQGKANTHLKYKNLVENEFRNEGVMLIETHKLHSIWMSKHKLFEKIQELNSRIRTCNAIWEKHAYRA